jgi:NAD(P)-dependent dehydrogenase (short-subunit alcohol dehydrogenase family)
MASNKTVIVTGASQGIGAAVVQAFLGRGYNVVATSRSVSKAGFAPRRTSPSSMETSVKPRPLRTSHRPRSASSVQLIVSSTMQAPS